jgi:nitrous oxidase accessory protein NosD
MITTRLTIDGTGADVTIAGGPGAATGLVFGPGSAGSTLRGIRFQGFAAAAVVLDSSPGTLVDGITVVNSGTGLEAFGDLAGAVVFGSTFTNQFGFGIALFGATGLTVEGNTVTSRRSATSMGFYATGNLTDTLVVSNIFRGGLRGALLDSARGLTFGAIGRGNQLLGALTLPRTQFAGTGIRAQGDMAGTTIQSNLFSGNNFGMAFVNARGLRFGGSTLAEANRIVRSRTAGIVIEGNNQGSQRLRTLFGAGRERNRTNIVRRRGARGA